MNSLSLEEKKCDDIVAFLSAMMSEINLKGLSRNFQILSLTSYGYRFKILDSNKLVLDPFPSLGSANIKNNIILDKFQKKQIVTIHSGEKLWGESYRQEARCEEIKLKTIISLEFNDGFTYLSNGLSIICVSFTQKSFQIIEFTSSKLKLLHNKKDKFISHLFFILCISISLMYSYEYDISHLAEEMFENSHDKQNNEAFELAISPVVSLFQAVSNAKRLYQTTQYNRALTPFSPRQLFLIKLVSCQPINNIAVPGRIRRKQSLSRETFRCLNPLHKESLYFKIHFSGFIKCFNRYVQHPGHKLLNCLWIFLKDMDTKYLKKFDNLSTI